METIILLLRMSSVLGKLSILMVSRAESACRVVSESKDEVAKH